MHTTLAHPNSNMHALP